MELTALIQKDPKWLLLSLECYLPRYLHFKEAWAPKLGDISWWQRPHGILAPGAILFINRRAEVKIQAHYVSRETFSGGERYSCLLPILSREKSFSLSLTYGVFSSSSRTFVLTSFLFNITFYFILFIFWPCWVFVAACGLSLVAASRG